MNPNVAQELEKVLIVTFSSTVGFMVSFALTGSLVHGLIVTAFCVAMFYWIAS